MASKQAKQAARRRSSALAQARRKLRNMDRWWGGPEGHGNLPKTDTLTAADLPRLERAAAKQMERNRRRLGDIALTVVI